MSVTAAFIFVKTGAHDGFVDGQTIISPGLTSTISLASLSTLAGPSTTPADDPNPFISFADKSAPFSHSSTLPLVIPHSMTVNGSDTSSGGIPSPGTGTHFLAASSIFSLFSAFSIQYLLLVGAPTPNAQEVTRSSRSMGTSNLLKRKMSSVFFNTL